MIADVALWPEQASTVAVQVDRLLFLLVALCGTVGLLIAALLIYFCIRYRRRPGETPKRVESYPPPTSTPPIEDTDSASPKDR
jgi:heme/copper-type cytochrome/quinol oxidase subunit 2